MVDVEPVAHQRVLRHDHVGISVVRERRLQSVARLARSPMPDVIRQDDEVASRIEYLPGPEQLSGELRPDELRPGPAGTVHDQDRVDDVSGGIPAYGSKRPVVQPKLRQRLAAGEVEVAHHEIVTRWHLRPDAGGADQGRTGRTPHPTPHRSHDFQPSRPCHCAETCQLAYPLYSRGAPLASRPPYHLPLGHSLRGARMA